MFVKIVLLIVGRQQVHQVAIVTKVTLKVDLEILYRVHPADHHI